MRRTKSTVALVVAAGLIVLALATGWPAIVKAFNPQPDPPGRFGMVGIARGQTARLNVVNLAEPPEPGMPSEPCAVTLRFVDWAGGAFVDRQGDAITSEVVLPAVQSAFLDLRAADALRSGDGRRAQLRARVEPGSERGGAVPHMNPCGRLVATLEVFDNATGQTMLLYHPPDPGASAVGDASGLPDSTEIIRGQ